MLIPRRNGQNLVNSRLKVSKDQFQMILIIFYNYNYKMNKPVLLFSLLALVCWAGDNTLSLQLGNSFATTNLRGSAVFGYIPIVCVGGTGYYTYSFQGLPAGWTVSNNVITVPDITKLKGNYIIRIKVNDLRSQAALQRDVKFIIDGINIFTQTINPNNNVDGQAGNSSSQVVSTSLPKPLATGIQPIKSQSNSNGVRQNLITALYQSYPGVQNVAAPTAVQGGRFPTPALPSGNPAVPNIVPTIIKNTQATFIPERDSNPITLDSIRFIAANQRHLNSIRGVANLIQIIKKLRANINAGKEDVVNLQKRAKEAQQNHYKCNDDILDLTNVLSQVQNAIKDRQNKISNAKQNTAQVLQPSLNQLNNNRSALISKKNQIQKYKLQNSFKVNDFQKKLNDCNSAKQKDKKQLDDISLKINEINTNLKKIEDEVAQTPNLVKKIDEQIPAIDNKIEDLKKQFEDLNRQKNRLSQQRDNHQKTMKDSSRKVMNLQRQLKLLNQRVSDKQNKVFESDISCNNIQNQLNSLKRDMVQKEVENKTLDDQINTLESFINDRKSQIQKNSDVIGSLTQQFVKLRQQLQKKQQALTKQYYTCNDVADSVLKAKQNLNAMQQKIKSQEKQLAIATTNLQKARSQKQLANFASDQLMRLYTNVLPYPIIPNALGINNIEEALQSSNSPNKIPNIESYLQQVYKSNANSKLPKRLLTVKDDGSIGY